MGLHSTAHSTALRSTTPTTSFGTALAAGVPFVCYLATASGHGHWLDSGVIVAQARDFGISHPPGHPLAGLVHGLAGLLPLGPLGFRVALCSAVLTAVAAACVFHAGQRTFRAFGIHRALATPIALGATWWVAGSYGWWFQAVRPEVYALQAALIALALERLTAVEASGPDRDVRPLLQAAFALGLALANHHFLALLVLPALAPTLARVVRSRGAKSALVASAFGAAGLATYVYLPLRAMSDASLRLGMPSNAERFYWVVSAQAFQKNTGDGVPQPLGERFADVALQLGRDLHPVTFVLALAGAYFLLRLRETRAFGGLWLLVCAVFVAARAWLGFVRSNPDALGYLMPASAALAMLAAAVVAGLAYVALGGAAPRWSRALVWVLAFATLGQVFRSGREASLASFRDTDIVDDGLRRNLPHRAVVLAFTAQTAFRYWGGESTEDIRPDVTVVPIPLVSYPGLVDELATETPELRPLLRAYLLEGELRLPPLQTLAGSRPVLLELDPHVPESLYATLVPGGFYYRVLTEEAAEADRQAGAATQTRYYRQLYQRLGQPEDTETRHLLLWHHYQNALFHAALGDRESARQALEWAEKLAPEEPVLQALAEALSEPGEDGEATGAIDIAPFRVGGPGPASYAP